MDNNGYSLADLSAMTNGSGFGGNSIWLIILFILIFGGNGFGYGNNNALTQQDALMNANFQNLSQNVNDIANRQYEQANNLTKGICELGYTVAQQTNNLQTNLGTAIVTEGRNTQQGLCDLKTAIHAEGEATRAMLQANKIEELQAQVTELKTQQMFCGLPRINPYGYQVVPNSCGCNNF